MALLVALSALSHRRHEHHVSRVLHSLSPHNVTLPNASFYNEALADHFDELLSQLPKRWSQRYYVDARFWCGRGCPIFLYIGGEGPQSPTSPRLFMWTLAERHGALMLALEHRFYGESRPAADMSIESLALLTSTQALADLARFVSYVKAYDPSEPDDASTPPLFFKSGSRGPPAAVRGRPQGGRRPCAASSLGRKYGTHLARFFTVRGPIRTTPHQIGTHRWSGWPAWRRSTRGVKLHCPAAAPRKCPAP